jgi:hypothetical protein
MSRNENSHKKVNCSPTNTHKSENSDESNITDLKITNKRKIDKRNRLNYNKIAGVLRTA